MFAKAAGKRSRDDWEEIDDVEELKSVIEAKEVTFRISLNQAMKAVMTVAS